MARSTCLPSRLLFCNLILVSMLWFCLWTTSQAQESITKKFIYRAHSYQGQNLPYRLFVPDAYVSQQRYPLVLTLHGSGERGTNNTSQISGYRIATVWADAKNQVTHPCLVVSPQCPPSASWRGDMLLVVNDLLDSLQREFSIDANRLYITGLSMGGFGTFEMIQRFPDRFAAAVPMSAGADIALTAPLLHQAIWNFHGENDESVPVIMSRNTIQALEFAGRPAVYTHCEYGDCSGMSLAEVQQLVQNHTDLFYTELQGRGHVMWNEAYDYPPLVPWVFQQVRRDSSVIRLASLQSYQMLQGNAAVTWRCADSTDRIQLWYDVSLGTSWQFLAEIPNTGIYAWDTAACPDVAKGKLRLYALASDGKIKGYDESAWFTVNNASNCSPFAWINTPIWPLQLLDQNEMALSICAFDAESDPLNTKIEYCSDDGRSYNSIAQSTLSPDTAQQFLTVNLGNLSNSSHARLRLAVDDGVTTTFYTTRSFRKITPRKDSLQVSHVRGTAGAEVKPIVVDEAQLNGALYRIQFSDSSGYLAYAIINTYTGALVLQNVPAPASAEEGPVFDGLALSIKDMRPPQPDYDHSGWSKGQATLAYSMYIKDYRIAGILRKSYPQPDDYLISFYDQIVDTSAAVFSVPAVPLRYTIRNLTQDRAVESLFIDTNKDQWLSRQEYIYLIEPDSLGQSTITWSLYFFGDSTVVLPKGGDEFTFKTLKPLTNSDVYEFYACKTGIDVSSDADGPAGMQLWGNYPNPFNASTAIVYDLTHDEKHLTLAIYNLLGQRVKLLYDGAQKKGHYRIRWDGRGDDGQILASGIFFYRLHNQNRDQIRTMVMLH